MPAAGQQLAWLADGCAGAQYLGLGAGWATVTGAWFAKGATTPTPSTVGERISASRSSTLGFLACYLGTILSKEEAKAERGFDELYVRSETGLGAEVGTGRGLTGRSAEPEPQPATTTR